MALTVALRDIDIEADTGLVYIDVDFYPSNAAKQRGDPPLATEDFRMQISRTVREASAFDANGRLTAWTTRQKTLAELRDEVRGNILRHAATLEVRAALRGDRRLKRKPIMRSDDPEGIKAALLSLRESRA